MSKLKGAAKRILGGLKNRFSKLARFGQRKHEAKQAVREAYIKEHGTPAEYNPARVDGIFNLGTMETYRAAMQPFAKWLSAHKVKNASQIIKAHAAAYLQEREAAGLSFRTVSRDMATINKAMGLTSTRRSWGCAPRKSRRSPTVWRRRKTTGRGLEGGYRIKLPSPKPVGAVVPPSSGSPPTTVCATARARW